MSALRTRFVSILWVIIGLGIIPVALIGLLGTYTMHLNVSDVLIENIVKSQKTVQMFVDDKFEVFMNGVKKDVVTQSIRPNIINGVRELNEESLRKFAKSIISSKLAEVVLFTDAKGNVIVRGHEDKKGDNIFDQHLVKQALTAREANVGIYDGGILGLSIRAAAPIMDGSELLGCVVFGEDLLKGEKFVDKIQKNSGMAMTVFRDTERVATTVKNPDGNRAVGTKMTNQKVIDSVLKRGEIFSEVNEVQGVKYQGYYWPIRGDSEKIVGMLFVGNRIDFINDSIMQVIMKIAMWLSVPFVLIVIVTVFLARKLANNIKALSAYSQEIAAGNLDAKLAMKKPNNELGVLADSMLAMVGFMKQKIEESQSQAEEARRLTNQANEAMRQAEEAQQEAARARKEGLLHSATLMQEIADKLHYAMAQVNEKLKRIDDGAGQQSEKTAETATAMEQMNASVLEIAKSSSETAQKAESTRAETHTVSQRIHDLVAAFEGIHKVIQTLAQDMRELSKKSSDIGNVVGVISDIADQTNLLALNAAIEAARAGDAGRGFAVVADEVRKLAEKTMTATKEVAASIGGVQALTKQNMDTVSASAAAVDNALVSAHEAQGSLDVITSLTQETAGLVDGIATASEEQSAASEQINGSVTIIQQMADAARDEVHSAIQDELPAVQELVADLQKLADQLKKD